MDFFVLVYMYLSSMDLLVKYEYIILVWIYYSIMDYCSSVDVLF